MLPGLYCCCGPANWAVMTSALLQPQFSCKASRKLGQQQLGIHARFTSSCSSLVPWVPKQSPLLECFRCTRQRHHGPAVLVTAKMDMRVMVKLSVARSSGKLDLSNCGLTEVPAEVCDLRDLQASTCNTPAILCHGSSMLFHQQLSTLPVCILLGKTAKPGAGNGPYYMHSNFCNH